MPRSPRGRLAVRTGFRLLIRQEARDNTTPDRPRVMTELQVLMHDVADTTAARRLPGRREPLSQTWNTLFNEQGPPFTSAYSRHVL
jgi:hypothetical protein